MSETIVAVGDPMAEVERVVDGWRLALRDEGYVIAPALLDPSTIEALRAAFPPASPGSTSHVALDDRTPNIDHWRGLLRHREVATLLAGCLGEFGVYTHGREPGPAAGAQGLHSDRPAGRVSAVDAVTIIWMLDDFTAENGATRVVPRSHRGAAAVPRHLAQPDIRHPDELTVCGVAGDVLIFDAHLWHSGQRNRNGARRRAVQMTATRHGLTTPGTARAAMT